MLSQDNIRTKTGDACNDRDFVMASDLDKHCEPRQYEELFYKLVERAELEDANTTTTMNCYGHLLPDHRADWGRER